MGIRIGVLSFLYCNWNFCCCGLIFGNELEMITVTVKNKATLFSLAIMLVLRPWFSMLDPTDSRRRLLCFHPQLVYSLNDPLVKKRHVKQCYYTFICNQLIFWSLVTNTVCGQIIIECFQPKWIGKGRLFWSLLDNIFLCRLTLVPS